MTDHDQTTGDGGSGAGPRGKVATLIDEYGLTGIGDKLVDAWTTDTDERKSLRELANDFNEELLAEALRNSAAQTLDGEATNFYRLLTSDDVSSGTRIEAENRLEEHGVDVSQLRDDFVSRQAVHTYLTKERDASYAATDETDEERIESRLQTVQRLKSRLVAVAEQTLSELTTAGLVSVGNPQVIVLVRVQCGDCGVQYPFSELVRTGSCQCPADTNRES